MIYNIYMICNNKIVHHLIKNHTIIHNIVVRHEHIYTYNIYIIYNKLL